MSLLEVNELRKSYAGEEVVRGYAVAGFYAALVLTRRRLLS